MNTAPGCRQKRPRFIVNSLSLLSLLTTFIVPCYAQSASTTTPSLTKPPIFSLTHPSSISIHTNTLTDSSFSNFRFSSSASDKPHQSTQQSALSSTIRWGELALQPFGSFATKPTTALNDPLLTPRSQVSDIRFGTQISREFSTDWGRLTPYATLDAQRESQSDWVGDFQQTDSRYNLGLGFEAAFSQQAKAFMSYETSLSADDDNNTHRVYAGWLFNF